MEGKYIVIKTFNNITERVLLDTEKSGNQRLYGSYIFFIIQKKNLISHHLYSVPPLFNGVISQMRAF